MTSTARVFRHDINGLRAWAVIAVVLFHFGIPGFAGGFVGVDVFFVISGFLMTQIIVSGLETGKFSIWHFYLARARRIIPALMALCITLLVLGWFFLVSTDYTTLAKHVLTAILFVSNVKFWREAGYFDADSHEKWLLHTWSLSVEWQFYIILPIALVFMARLWRTRGIQLTIFVGLILSFALSCYLAIKSPSSAFYLLPTRAWEMLAGGAVWGLTRNVQLHATKAKWLEWSGFALIIAAITLFNPGLAWPGLYAAVPVTGAMLVLAASRQNSLFTSNYLAERLGVSSYSIYLWHWPIVVFLGYNNAASSWNWLIAGIILSLILGELSLRMIENPARKRLSRQTAWGNVFTIATCTTVIGFASIALFKINFPNRVPQQIDVVANESLNVIPNRDKCIASTSTRSPECIYGGHDIKAVVVGDSHADAMLTGVVAALPDKNDGVLDLTYASCPTLFGAKMVPGEVPGSQCHEFNQWERERLKRIDRTIPIVIINRSSVYAFGQHNIVAKMNMPMVYFSKVYSRPTPEFLKEFKKDLVATACELAIDHPVFLVRPTPEMMLDVPKTLSRSMMLGKSMHIYLSEEDYHKRHQFVWEAQDEAAEKCGVKILNPLPMLCKNGLCESTHNGRPIYYDDDHLSEYGNKLLVPMFQQIFL
ncbi:acyltransferase [Serratia marcescens]|uniref:acyltransferase family protein n=1 Tax=Serratia marcescens TaxID=615 RepID=UPI001C591635|nr:acyltransferase family protein [Serratia marcescens]QXX94623.1 acyltransferase [Serratia marcescens]